MDLDTIASDIGEISSEAQALSVQVAQLRQMISAAGISADMLLAAIDRIAQDVQTIRSNLQAVLRELGGP